LLFILATEYFKLHRLYRSQLAIIMTGVSIPVIGAGLTTLGVEFPGQRDIAPITFAFQNMFLIWGFFRFRILDIIPIARDRVVEKMPDPVIVLDAQDRVVDVNPAAQRVIGLDEDQVIGRPASEVFGNWPELIHRLSAAGDGNGDAALWTLEDRAIYEVKSSSLVDRRGEAFGRVFVCRDVSAHVDLEQNLSGLNDDLEKRVLDRTLQVERAYDTTLEGWARTLELRDAETEGHTRRVTRLTVGLARALGVSEMDLVHIRRGAVLHDIGKMAIPDEILRKRDPLTFEEWTVLSRHPVIAYELLSPIEFLADAIVIPYCHHEHWDGTGYPRGLSGEEIPLPARIFAVVDVWDAVQSDRPYKAGWSRSEAVEHLRTESGRLFDPHIVEVFLGMIEAEQAGDSA
jgi:PAS domain S-box-containing protein